jgi:hypothetical protein
MDLEIYDWISLSSTHDSRKILRVPKWVCGGRLFVVSAHDGSIITRVFLLSLAGVLVPNGYMAVGYLLFLQEQIKDIIIIIKILTRFSATHTRYKYKFPSPTLLITLPAPPPPPIPRPLSLWSQPGADLVFPYAARLVCAHGLKESVY